MEINHLPKGGGQFDPPLPRAIRTSALPGLQHWVSALRVRIGTSVVKEKLTTDANDQKTAAQCMVERADLNQPNMLLKTKIRKSDAS
ncbi:hypothetical protein BER92_15465 [Xanthomonas fragariae]|nr:hypothetical protein BER92_15465 [Xanthomonas fragariae]